MTAGLAEAADLYAVLADLPGATATPTVLLVEDAGLPVVVARHGQLLLLDPDQLLSTAVAAVVQRLPGARPSAVRQWIAAGRFLDNDTPPGGTL